jgi:Kef-type K+ transport system membrane component KefB
MVAAVLWFGLITSTLGLIFLLFRKPVYPRVVTYSERDDMWVVFTRVLYILCLVLALMAHAEQCT